MRSYPCNSPEAAARIVALVSIADGHICRSELDALIHEAASALGLAPEATHRIVRDLCEDLLVGAYAGGSGLANVDDHSLASILGEIDDPLLRERTLELAIAAARADRHLSDGEAVVLAAAVRHWGIDETEANWLGNLHPCSSSTAARVDPFL